MNPQTIGSSMPYGFAGSYARQPDMIVLTKPLGGTENVAFGLALMYDASKNVVPMGTGATAASFVGVAAREVKSAVTYLEQGTGGYAPKDPVPVFCQGSINVKCNHGTPALGGSVYVRIAKNGEPADYEVIGGFEAAADTTNTVLLSNAQWAGPADANGIAEMRIFSMVNA